MTELPIFPLNTVLFPYTPLNLHIFEERYQRMIRLCLHERRPFGVTLIRRGREAFGPPAEPYTIGCTATILGTQKLEGGRFNLLAMGDERFRIESLDTTSQPYLVAETQIIPWSLAGLKQMTAQVETLRERMLSYMKLLAAGKSMSSPEPNRFPDEPLPLACVAASILQIEPVEKQALLELEDAALLVKRLLALYRRENALIQAIQSHGERDLDLPFSLN